MQLCESTRYIIPPGGLHDVYDGCIWKEFKVLIFSLLPKIMEYF